MPFSISFLDEPVFYEEQTPMAVGELVLGDFRENFVASLYQWNKIDYKAQWRDAIKTLLDSSKSALIVEYVSPEFSNKLEWWPMYRIENVVYIQNHLLFYERLKKPFSLKNMFSFVKDRITIAEDGNRISEWNVNLSDVEDFARTLPI
jgi:hypothetical protein